MPSAVTIRAWAEGDLPLLQRLMGDPLMTEHLGGPESPEQIRLRHERYCKTGGSDTAALFVIGIGPEMIPAGSVGYWEKAWQERTIWEIGWSVLPEFQRQGIAGRAAALAIEQARSLGKHQFIHAFPSIDNAPSNAICRKLGFSLNGAADFEYPPGHFMRCNDWFLDLCAA